MPVAKIKDVSINYYTFGEGNSLILIAGLGVDSMCWFYQIPFFKNFFKVIVFDNRGIGKSTGFKGRYSIKMMADDVAELLEHLKIQKSHVLGSSMGGMIAQEFAITYPEIVDKLILCSTFAKPQFMVDNITRGLRKLLKGKLENIFEINPRKIVYEKLFNYLLQQMFNEEFLKKNRKFVEETWQKYLFAGNYTETFFKQIGAVHRHDTLNRLNLIKSETLVLTGTEDKLIIPGCSNILAKKIPKSTLIKIDNVGHGLHFEMPDIFNKIVIEFLSV